MVNYKYFERRDDRINFFVDMIDVNILNDEIRCDGRRGAGKDKYIKSKF